MHLKNAYSAEFVHITAELLKMFPPISQLHWIYKLRFKNLSVTSNLRVYNAWINGNYVNAYIRNMAVNTDYKDQTITVQLYFLRNI